MKKFMFSAALALALSACGGKDGVSWRDPDSFDPEFGSPSSTLTTGEAAAANGSAVLADAPALVDETDGTTAETRGMNVANLPNQMQAAFGDSYGESALRAQESAVRAQGLALLAGAPNLAAESPWADCVDVTATEIVYEDCRQTVVDGETTRIDTLDGRIAREDGRVTWDVTIGMSVRFAGLEESFTDRLRGEVAFSTGDQTIAGSSRSDIFMRAVAMGYTAEAAVTFSADYDLDYAIDPTFCVTGGTLTAKRLWSLLPAGANPSTNPELRDAAVQFTWQGCGAVQVAWSVD